VFAELRLKKSEFGGMAAAKQPGTMNTPSSCLRSVVAGLVLSASAAFGQSTTTTTTTSSTTSDGTVSDFSPNTITVRSTSSTTPVAYSYSKTTTYVDEAGNPVSMETVHSGAPVTVYYTSDGGAMTATKVVVHRVTTTTDAPADVTTVKKTSTTTTTTGTAQ
jgi:hypothetical protein